MTTIKLFVHPLDVDQVEIFQAGSLAEWLVARYSETTQARVQVFVGEPSAATEITYDLDAIIRGDEELYTVLQVPSGFDPFTWVLIISAVVSVAVVLLLPKPDMPSNVLASNRTQSSPNNALANRENKVRLMERVEDIYGTIKSIPSLMAPTYSKYLAHVKYEYGYYCVGRGYHDIDDVRDGDTLISSITGASAAFYAPFTSPNSGHAPQLLIGDAIIDDVLTASRAIEVDGITLKAFNQIQLPATGSYSWAALGGITQAIKNPNFNAILSLADTITLTGATFTPPATAGSLTMTAATRTVTDLGGAGEAFANLGVFSVLTFSGWANGGNNITITVASKPDANTITFTGGTPVNESATVTVTVTPATINLNQTGVGLVIVGDGTITPYGVTSPIPVTITCTILKDGVTDEYTDWVTLPDLDRTEVWCNIIAPNGMYKDSGGKSATTTAFSIEIEKLDTVTLLPLGSPVVETVTGSVTGSVSDLRAETVEHATAWTGPCRVRMRRTTAYDYAFAGTVIDEIKWADLYSVSPVTKTEFGNKTTVHTITKATDRATAVKTRQLNCLASRKLPTFNGTVFSGAFDATGLHTTGTIAATSKICDIIAAVAVDPLFGARDLSTEVDMAQIWATQLLLDAWNTSCGEFNYTFDTDNLSFEEAVISIANAAFCIAYRQNGKLRLAFDRAQTSSAALFTHRNKKPASETITRRFYSGADYDGVEFVYADPDSERSETIKLPLAGTATKYKKFEIAGIRSFAAAWFRANREYYKLLGQRITVDTMTTLDARSLLPNARVDIVDNTLFRSFDGEVVAQNGLALTLSTEVEFIPATAHSIVLMRRDGSLQSIACTAGGSAYEVVLAGAPAEAIVTTGGADGIRTIFSFAADSARGAMAYLVQELDITDSQYVSIRGVNYSADYYQADLVAVPDKTTIIN